jgi:multidrug resistance efflux pump
MGATVIMFLLLLFLAGTWFIRYPEVLKGAVLVTTAAPTLKVVSEGEGRMMRLLVTNGSMVRKGDVLAEMENRTRLENTPMLQNLLRETQLFLQNPKRSIQLPNDSLTGAIYKLMYLHLANITAISNLQTDDYHAITRIQPEATNRSLAPIATGKQTQKRLEPRGLSQYFRWLPDRSKLFSEGIYSRTEFQKKENEYLGKRREQEDYAENMIKNDLKITEIEAELKTVEYAFLEKQRFHLAEMAMAVRNIENGLRNWQEQYLILAPSDGRLAYLQNLAENQFVKAGETLFAIKPAQEDFVAMVDIPVRGMGKAKVGQTVILKLDDYPFQEFGTIEGKVVSMAPSTDVKTYRMMVALPNGLRSSYHRDFVCKSEMAGSVEIITDDMRLFERAFYGIRKLVM